MKMETTVNKSMRVLILLGLAAFAIALTALLTSGFAAASSHREAPAISKDAFADTTDVYAFIPPGITDTIVLAASWIPFEGPEGGPNYFEWDDDVLYDIYVDNDGDAQADITYTLKSNTTIRDPDNTFLYNTGPINSVSDTTWNRPQTYSITEFFEPGTQPPNRDHVGPILSNVFAPPVNIGSKSTPDYASLVAETTYTYTDSRNGDQLTIFAGQTDDAFWVDLQVFDLLTLRGQNPPIGYVEVMGDDNDPVDSVAGFNVHTLVIEAPIDRLTQDGEPVLGVWAGSRRAAMGAFTSAGGPVQVSRLGMPLVNEAVIPMGLKDTFNAIPPSADLTVYGLLQESVENPELGTLLCALYSVPLPGDSDADCNTEYTAGTPRTGRGDIFDIFLTGMVLANEFTINTASGPVTLPVGFNVNQPVGVVPAEMLRINTAISGDLCSPDPSVLGVLGGDACGFPNGRRLTDEVVEIELLAVAGAVYEVLDDRDASFSFNAALIDVLNDGIGANDVPFTRSGGRNHIPPDLFPYFGLAQSGQDHIHDNPQGASTAINLESLQSAGMFDSALPEIALGLLALTIFVGAVYATRIRANRQ